MSAIIAKTFVLVHGAWHGGWCWRRVVGPSGAAGPQGVHADADGPRRAQPPAARRTSTSAPTSPTWSTCIKWERLSGVVLCGHSYGGMVVVGRRRASRRQDRLDRVPRRLRAGERRCAGRPHRAGGARRRCGRRSRSGDLGMPPRPAAAFAVNEKDRAWVDAMCVPQPIGTFTEKMTLTGARERIGKKTYIRAANYHQSGLRQGAGAGQGRQVVAHLRGAVRPRRDGRHAGAARGDFARGGVGATAPRPHAVEHRASDARCIEPVDSLRDREYVGSPRLRAA